MNIQFILMTIIVALTVLSGSSTCEEPRYTPACDDSLYNYLKSKSLDEMSDREYQYFIQKDKQCFGSASVNKDKMNETKISCNPSRGNNRSF